MGMISQMISLSLGRHDGRVGISRAHAVISHSPVTAMYLFTVGPSSFLDPVMAISIGRGELFALFLRQSRWQQRWRWFLRGSFFQDLRVLFLTLSRKQLRQMRFNCKT